MAGADFPETDSRCQLIGSPKVRSLKPSKSKRPTMIWSACVTIRISASGHLLRNSAINASGSENAAKDVRLLLDRNCSRRFLASNSSLQPGERSNNPDRARSDGNFVSEDQPLRSAKAANACELLTRSSLKLVFRSLLTLVAILLSVRRLFR